MYGPSSYGPSKGSSSSTSPRSSGQRGDQSARWGKYGGNGGNSDEDGEDDGDEYGKSNSSYGISKSDNQKNKKKKKGEMTVSADRQLTSAEQAIRERRANRFQKDYEDDQLGKGTCDWVVILTNDNPLSNRHI